MKNKAIIYGTSLVHAREVERRQRMHREKVCRRGGSLASNEEKGGHNCLRFLSCESKSQGMRSSSIKCFLRVNKIYYLNLDLI